MNATPTLERLASYGGRVRQFVCFLRLRYPDYPELLSHDFRVWPMPLARFPLEIDAKVKADPANWEKLLGLVGQVPPPVFCLGDHLIDGRMRVTAARLANRPWIEAIDLGELLPVGRPGRNWVALLPLQERPAPQPVKYPLLLPVAV